MKNKEYIKGIATGVALSLAVGAGGYLGYRSQYDGVLSESEHVGKLKYLEHLIDEEYLGEVDQENLQRGFIQALYMDWEMCIPDITQQRNISRKILPLWAPMWELVLQCRKMKEGASGLWNVTKKVRETTPV